MKLVSRSFHLLAISAFHAGQPQKAESNWRRSIDLTPDWPYPYLSLARYYQKEGRQQDAERELRMAEQGVPGRHADVLRAQAEFFAAQGFSDRASVLCRKALQATDSNVDDRINLARHLAQSGDLEAGLTMLRTVVQEHPADLSAFEEMARMLERQHQEDQARRARQVVELELSSSVSEARPKVINQALSTTGVQQFTAPVRQSPLGEVWDLLRSELKAVYAPPVVDSSLPVPPSIAAATECLRTVFGYQFNLSFCDVDDPVITVHPEHIFLSKASPRSLTTRSKGSSGNGHGCSEIWPWLAV